jgi:hypothetical protein
MLTTPVLSICRSPLLPRTHYTVTVHREAAEALEQAQREAAGTTVTAATDPTYAEHPLLKENACIRHLHSDMYIC